MGTQRALIPRRRLVELGALLALSTALGCGRRERAAVLSGLITKVVVEMARDLRAESIALQTTLRALSSEPSPPRQRAAQSAFQRAVLAWKRAYAFRLGPFATSEAFQRAAFWPARATSIEPVLGAAEPIDDRRVQALGVDARGLFALEYLLFDPEHAASAAAASGASGERVRAYALELGTNVRGYADRVQRLLGDGRQYAETFAQGGQHSVEALVTQTRDTLDVILGKFARVERARRDGVPLEFAVEGYFSGSSLEIVQAILAGAESLYGGGLSELVAAASEPIDQHVRSAFREAGQRLKAMDAPLEVALAAQPDRFQSAASAVAELRHVIEVELQSALSG